jgi:thiol-disulfide isomerase/thioredoxin
MFDPSLEKVAQIRDRLKANKELDSPMMDSVQKLISVTKDKIALQPLFRKRNEIQKSGDDLTAKGKWWKKEKDSVQMAILNYRYHFINSHLDIVAYFLMQEDVYYHKEQPGVIDHVQQAYPTLAARFPNHIYTERVGNEMRGYLKLVPGGKFIDFSAPDLSGNEHALSDLVKDKVTLIDFWGSWCGSCIAYTHTMMPVYDDFKAKGFNVVGIAREFKNTKNLKIALKRDKYPWLNLLELDDQHNIWSKYAISNSGGMMVLVDKTGEILAVNPSPDEVREILTAKL